MNTNSKIDEYLASLSGWQQANLAAFRQAVHEVVPDVEEAWKWSVPVFLANGKMVCAMSTFKDHTKYNFFEGAELDDPHELFNSGLDSKQHRSINLSEGQKVDTEQLKNLIAQAAARTK